MKVCCVITGMEAMEVVILVAINKLIYGASLVWNVEP